MTILLSHPRSGNTWIRYCIEHISDLQCVDVYYKNTIKEVLKQDKNNGDFITDTESELKKIMDFLDKDSSVEEFISNIDFHKKNSLNLYTNTQNNKSYTKGNDMNFYSKNINNETKNDLIDSLKVELNNNIKYLDRYDIDFTQR
jgi:hypothetical protein